MPASFGGRLAATQDHGQFLSCASVPETKADGRWDSDKNFDP
jgi:hypothetical protein